MTLKERFDGVLSAFAREMPIATTELEFGSVFQLLIAVILSAQCTDKRVNMVTPALFDRYPDAISMATATEDEIRSFISSVTYPNSKSRNILRTARILVEKFGGEVPEGIDDLMSLPGVGRKTANVMLAVAWDKAAMPVDTHVFRVSNRIGLTRNSKTPLETERTLVKHIPAELLSTAHHWLILHGRYVCKARKPDCESCVLTEFCKEFKKRK